MCGFYCATLYMFGSQLAAYLLTYLLTYTISAKTRECVSMKKFLHTVGKECIP